MSICCTCPCLADINKTNESSNKDDMNFSEHVVFNEDDVILQNGYVERVSSTLFGNSKPLDISLYVISPTVDGCVFHAVHRYKISKNDYSKPLKNGSIVLSDSKLYIEAGQFLAIGFDRFSKYIVADEDGYKLFRNEIDSVEKNNQFVALHTNNSKIDFSFRLVPTEGKSILNPKSIYMYTCISRCFQISFAIFSFGPYLVIATIRASVYVHTVR
jgi:hypothetical protein